MPFKMRNIQSSHPHHSPSKSHYNHYHRRTSRTLRSLVIALSFISLLSRIVYATYATWYTITTFDCLPCNATFNDTNNRLFISKQSSTNFKSSRGMVEIDSEGASDLDLAEAKAPLAQQLFRIKRDVDDDLDVSDPAAVDLLDQRRREATLIASTKTFEDIAKEWMEILSDVTSSPPLSSSSRDQISSTDSHWSWEEDKESYANDDSSSGQQVDASLNETKSTLIEPKDDLVERQSKKLGSGSLLDSSDLNLNVTSTISPLLSESANAEEFKITLNTGPLKKLLDGHISKEKEQRMLKEHDQGIGSVTRREDWSFKVNPSSAPKIDVNGKLKAQNGKKKILNSMSTKFDFNYPAIFSDENENSSVSQILTNSSSEISASSNVSDKPNSFSVEDPGNVTFVIESVTSPSLSSSHDLHSFVPQQQSNVTSHQAIKSMNLSLGGEVSFLPDESSIASIKTKKSNQDSSEAKETVNKFEVEEEIAEETTNVDLNATCSHDCNRFLSIELSDPNNRKWAMILITGVCYLYAFIMLFLFFGVICTRFMDLLVIATFLEGAKLFVGFILLVIDNFNGKKIAFNLIDVQVKVDSTGKGWNANFTYSEYLLDLILFVAATSYAIRTMNNRYFARKCKCVTPEEPLASNSPKSRGNRV